MRKEGLEEQIYMGVEQECWEDWIVRKEGLEEQIEMGVEQELEVEW